MILSQVNTHIWGVYFEWFHNNEPGNRNEWDYLSGNKDTHGLSNDCCLERLKEIRTPCNLKLILSP